MSHPRGTSSEAHTEAARKNGAKGGRPKGQLAILSRRRAGRLIHHLEESGETALDVMVDNMLFWHRAAKNLGERIEAVLNLDKEGMSLEEKREVAGLLKNFVFARDRSQACAEGAAQYMHPRLQAVAIQKETKELKITMTLPPARPGEDRSYRYELPNEPKPVEQSDKN